MDTPLANKIIVNTALLLVLACGPLFPATDSAGSPHMSFGVAGSFGFFNAYERNSSQEHIDWEYGMGYGGGLVFEKMFNNRLGIQSGIWYQQFQINLHMMDTNLAWTNRALLVPMYLVISFNTKPVSLNILAGFFAEQFLSSEIEGGGQSADMIRMMSSLNAGISGGLTVKFRAGDYTDIFIGGIADFMLTDIIKPDDDTYTHVYGFRAVSGILFRTNLFPIDDKPW